MQENKMRRKINLQDFALVSFLRKLKHYTLLTLLCMKYLNDLNKALWNLFL